MHKLGEGWVDPKIIAFTNTKPTNPVHGNSSRLLTPGAGFQPGLIYRHAIVNKLSPPCHS